MKKNILLILGLVIFCIPNICLAKTITIDNQEYSTSSIIQNENFTYDAAFNTLKIKNMTFKTIETAEDLKIILEGNNYLTNSNVDSNYAVISANSLEITGDGTLSVSTTGRFISCLKLVINNTNLKVNSSGNIFSNKLPSENIGYDTIINNSTLELETLENVFNQLNTNTYITNSNINVLKAKKVDGGINKFYIINSKMKVEEVNTFSFSGNVYLNCNSDFFVHALNNKLPNKNYFIDATLKALESSDGSTWNDINSSSKPNYLKIFPEEGTGTLNTELKKFEEELKNKEKALNSLESELQERNQALENKSQALNERENSLNLKEQELYDKENNLNERDKFLNNYSLKLHAYEEELKNKTLELEEERNNLNTLSSGLMLKEEELNQDTINLNEEKSKLQELQELLKNKELEIEKVKASLTTREKELEVINEKLALLEEYETSLQKREEEITREEEEDLTYRVSNNFKDNLETSNIVEEPKNYSKLIFFSGISFLTFLGLLALIFVLRGKHENNQ